MNTSLQVMITGAGRYIQGINAIKVVGEELTRLGHRKVGMIAGKQAFSVTKDSLLESLNSSKLMYDESLYSGFCTANDIDEGTRWAIRGKYDCLLGIGGGKVLDYCKAVASQAVIPVFTLPTIAATCAAFAPLSVIYNQNGIQEDIRFHKNSVSGVFVDTLIIANAPSRYLAAGIADAFAKQCEYTSMRKSISYQQLDFGRFIGANLGKTCNEVLHQCARKAYKDNEVHNVTKALNDAVACIIGVIGVVSGLGAFSKDGTSRFAIAHGLNEVTRGRNIPNPLKFLHGEVVGVGILAQLRINQQPKTKIARLEELFCDLNLPTRLSQIDMKYDDSKLIALIEDLMSHCHISPSFYRLVVNALFEIR